MNRANARLRGCESARTGRSSMVGGRSEQALVSQLAEETDSKPVQCEFESHRGHSFRKSVDAARTKLVFECPCY